MLKVDVDTDKINNDLLPIIREKFDKIVLVRDYATRVDFSYEEYDWANVCNKINECVEKTNDYLKWIEYINSLYVNELNTKADDISSIEVVEVSKNIIN